MCLKAEKSFLRYSLDFDIVWQVTWTRLMWTEDGYQFRHITYAVYQQISKTGKSFFFYQFIFCFSFVSPCFMCSFLACWLLAFLWICPFVSRVAWKVAISRPFLWSSCLARALFTVFKSQSPQIVWAATFWFKPGSLSTNWSVYNCDSKKMGIWIQ